MIRRRLLALAVCCALPLPFIGCGGDDDGGAAPAGTGTATSASPVVTVDRTTSPVLDKPASRFSILLTDVGTSGYRTNVPATYNLDKAMYAKSVTFESEAKGNQLLGKWGYVEGYETELIPEGELNNGAFRIYVEVHLFKTEDGAKQAYTYLKDRVASNGASEVTSEPVGNESSTWRAIRGKVESSSINVVVHQEVFRRGNLVAIVATAGAEPLMRVDQVRALALLMDQKATGDKPAITPTPKSNYTPPANPTPRVGAGTPIPAQPTPTPTR